MVTGAITMPRPDIEALIAHHEVRLAPPTTAALTSSSPRGPKPALVIHGTLWTCNAFRRLVLPLVDTGCRLAIPDHGGADAGQWAVCWCGNGGILVESTSHTNFGRMTCKSPGTPSRPTTLAAPSPGASTSPTRNTAPRRPSSAEEAPPRRPKEAKMLEKEPTSARFGYGAAGYSYPRDL